MGAGIFNVVIGLFFFVAGATKQLTLIFTNSSEALMIVGGAIAATGAWQLIRHRRAS